MKRSWTAEQKTAIVLQGLKGEVSVAELCRQHGITSVLWYMTVPPKAGDYLFPERGSRLGIDS